MEKNEDERKKRGKERKKEFLHLSSKITLTLSICFASTSIKSKYFSVEGNSPLNEKTSLGYLYTK